MLEENSNGGGNGPTTCWEIMNSSESEEESHTETLSVHSLPPQVLPDRHAVFLSSLSHWKEPCPATEHNIRY